MNKYKLKELNENIKELLGTKYDYLFKSRIISRGIKYSNLKLINNLNINNNLITAQVKGENIYDVKIQLEKDSIKSVYCSCPYHEKDIYCKHIYSVLYKLSKKDKEEAKKRYKKYVLYNANEVNNFFIDTNNIIKYNKDKFNEEFFNRYEDIFYDLDGKYDNLKLDKKSLSQLNDYLNIIKKDYEKVKNVYNEVLGFQDINLDIEDITKKEKEKNKIEKEIYKDDISIERLIEIRKNMSYLNFAKSDIEYVEDRINYYVEELENIEQIEQIKNKLKEINFSTSICDRTIRRLNGITKEDVEKLGIEDLKYFIYNTDDIFVLINIKKQMEKYKFDKEDYDDLDEYIKSSIDSIYKIEELKKVKKLMKEYKFNLSYINKAIYNLNHKIYKEKSDPLLRNLDAYIESRPMEVLEKVSEDNIKNDRDNRIIEKAIKNKKKKIKELKRIKRKEAIDDLLYSFAKIGAIFSVFSSDSKPSKNRDYSSLEQEEILGGNYEPYQFEEEDLEEDDYYFEDDID